MSVRKTIQVGAVLGACCVALLVGWQRRHRVRAVVERRIAATTLFSTPVAPGPPSPMSTVAVETIWKGGRKAGWDDWGWAPHQDVPFGPARIDMSNWAGWQLVRMGLAGEFGGLSFRFRAPPEYGDFLTVHLEGAADKAFPVISIDASRQKPATEGWADVAVSMGELNPGERPFDHVVFFVSKGVPKGWVSFDDIVLTAAPPPPPATVQDFAMAVETTAPPLAIHPLIYGNAMDFQHYDWTMGATSRRWGGNTTTRYNWKLGNAWNTGSDWFFENVGIATGYAAFLKEDIGHGISTALTVPTIGWVAKDTTSSSFVRADYGTMDAFDQWRPAAGNGKKDGKDLSPGSPSITSIEAPPAFIQQWVEQIRKTDLARGERSVDQYILDNEPNLWNSTHRDVHPAPLTYDELLQRTIDYGTAIRMADHDAVIAGPAAWGWPAYFYSAKDMEAGITLRPDRRAHDDLPLVVWYLKKLREYEQKTGIRIIDVLDLHFYPQGKGVYSSVGAKALDALRIRSTRGLWDPSYEDESWISEPVMLIPRMKKWVAENYPGLGLSIGEWNFGGEAVMSGALAVAEVLGRFGQLDVTSAYYWSNPPSGSPVYWAFRAFRNFDGKGGRFEDFSLPTRAPEGTSLFASRDQAGTHYVFIALNLLPRVVARAHIDALPCEHAIKREAFRYLGKVGTGFDPPEALPEDGPLLVDLPPYSITVVDVHLSPP